MPPFKVTRKEDAPGAGVFHLLAGGGEYPFKPGQSHTIRLTTAQAEELRGVGYVLEEAKDGPADEPARHAGIVAAERAYEDAKLTGDKDAREAALADLEALRAAAPEPAYGDVQRLVELSDLLGKTTHSPEDVLRIDALRAELGPRLPVSLAPETPAAGETLRELATAEAPLTFVDDSAGQRFAPSNGPLVEALVDKPKRKAAAQTSEPEAAKE